MYFSHVGTTSCPISANQRLLEESHKEETGKVLSTSLLLVRFSALGIVPMTFDRWLISFYPNLVGNEHDIYEDVNMEGWLNSRFTITVGAVDREGKHASYSTGGAALFIRYDRRRRVHYCRALMNEITYDVLPAIDMLLQWTRWRCVVTTYCLF